MAPKKWPEQPLLYICWRSILVLYTIVIIALYLLHSAHAAAATLQKSAGNKRSAPLPNFQVFPLVPNVHCAPFILARTKELQMSL